MLEIALKLVYSAVLAGAIGAERELTGKPAGLRTNILIGLGAAVFTMVSVDVAGDAADPGRIAAQIVSGVGFIGAGAIIQSRGSIVGLTTAATIWAVAGVGMAVGAGEAMLGTLATLAILSCLTLLRKFDPLGPHEKKTTVLEIIAQSSGDVADIMRSLSEGMLGVKDTHISKRGSEVVINVACAAKPSLINEIVASLSRRDDVRAVRATN